MATIRSRRDIPEWISDFVAGLTKKSTIENKELTATVNLEDLPKVVWNEETFHVFFDKETHEAKILNQFNNEVTTIPGVSTIEEVDQHLNGKTVEKSAMHNVESTLDAELEKVFAAFDLRIAENVAPEAPVTPEPTEVPSDSESVVNDIENSGVTADTVGDSNYYSKLSDLENQISQLTQTVTDLQGQLYAHTDPGPAFDSGAQDAELAHAKETEEATQKSIDIEHSVDLTTQEGRVSLVDKIDVLFDDSDLKVDEVEETELPAENPPVEDAPIEEENPVEDSPITEPIEKVEVPEVDEVKEDEVVEPELPTDVVEKEEPTDDSVVKDEETKEDSEVEDEPKKDVTLLNVKDAKIFRKKICPSCGEESLIRSTKVASFVGVYCNSCEKEYAVNTDNEDIYIKG